MGLRFAILGSGSSGNSTLISNGDKHILIDVGLSGRETSRRLRECGIEPGQISAIVVSHEHGDHCRGVGPFAKDLRAPVFITEGAYRAAELRVDPARICRIESGSPFEICGVGFTPFAVPHDAADPIGLAIERDGVRIAIALDLGYISNLVIERFRGCDALIIESNHDVSMLKVGPYPWALKQRVMSRRGHLSNDAVAEFLGGAFDGRARHVVLAHLSKNNNHPELALLSARQALEARSTLVNVQTVVALAEADAVGPFFDF